MIVEGVQLTKLYTTGGVVKLLEWGKVMLYAVVVTMTKLLHESTLSPPGANAPDQRPARKG
jgi:hypothetical protein